MSRSLPVLAVLLLLALPAGAQGRPALAGRGPAEGNARFGLLNTMRVDLLRLVTAQETFFSDAGTYAASVADLPRFKVPPRVTITLAKVSAKGWLAEATHADMRGLSCVIFVGEVEGDAPATVRDGKRPDEEGRPVCDGLP